MASKRRILFLAEGITMAHFVRAAALAESLNAGEWDVYFRTPKRYHAFLRQPFVQLGDLHTIDPGEFLESLARGTVSYSEEAIRAYVREDQAIMNDVRPDIVIGDFRLSLCISAPVCHVPFASIFNAQWSPYYAQPAIIPELPITRWISPSLLNRLFAVLRPAINTWHAKPVNDVRRSFGLPALPHNLRGVYTAGNLVLYPDIPEYVPLRDVPDHHHFVGICSWSTPTPKPIWWKDVMASVKPKIFIALGSSGAVKVLPTLLEAVSTLPVEVVLATSGRAVGPIPPSVHVADLLPYEETAAQSAVVVSQGGTAGLYMTLAAGTPALVIPNNIDTHQSAALLTKSGAGIAIRVEDVSVARVRETIQRMLAESSFKEAARKWASIFARHDTRTIFPDLLRRWFAAKDMMRKAV